MIDINSFNINYHGGFKKDIDIKIFKDKKYFIHGKSGIGESAMLKNIIGINNEYSGNIIMKNKNVEHNIKNISIT